MRLVGSDLAAERGGRPVFDGLTFTVGEGELLALTGPNGSGKSTLLRLIAGLLRPSAGSLALEPADDDEISAHVHYLGHLEALKSNLTLIENLEFWRQVWDGAGLSPDDALDRVGLARLADIPAGLLSAGQRRRVAIARLLLAKRHVWLLDEPTTALDAKAGGESRRTDCRSSRRRRDGGRGHASPLAGSRDDDVDARTRRMMRSLVAIAGQTARLSLKGGGGAFVGLVFFLAVITVVPFGIGPDLNLLSRIGPAILWIGALLATLLGLDRLFQDDREDGSLDLLVLAGPPLELIVLARAAGHWLATGLPLTVAAPFLGLLLEIAPLPLGVVTLTLLVGTPALTLVGTIGAALMTALGRGGLLAAVLVLPFTIPVLIFGVSVAEAVMVGPTPFMPPFLILIALTLIGAVVAPIAGAAAIRASLE